MKASEFKKGHWYTVELQDSYRVLKFVEYYDNTTVLMDDIDGYEWAYSPKQLREMTFEESAELLKELLQKLGNQLIDFIMELIEKVIDVAIAFIKEYIKFFYKTYGYAKCKILKKHTWQWTDERLASDYEQHNFAYVRLYECKHCGRRKTRIEVL